MPSDVNLPPIDSVDLPIDMSAFDAEYKRLYQAVADAYPPEVSFKLDQLLNYCTESINANLAWLTGETSQTSSDLQSQIASSEERWQQFLSDSTNAMQTLLEPTIRQLPNDSGFRQVDGLITANLLRGRYAQIQRMISMQMSMLEDQEAG